MRQKTVNIRKSWMTNAARTGCVLAGMQPKAKRRESVDTATEKCGYNP